MTLAQSIQAALPNWQLIIFIILVVIFLVTGTIITIVLLHRRYWNYKVTVMENQTGFGSRPKYNDRARLVSIGDGGEEIFWLKKTKKYKIGYGKYIGQNSICWTIGKDGYWYNNTFGDIDKALGEVGVIPVGLDQRYATSSARDLVKGSWGSKSFMEKYGTIMYFGLFMITMIVFAGVMWFAFSKQVQIAQANIETMKTAQLVLEKVGQVTSSLDTLCSGGSGLRHV